MAEEDISSKSHGNNDEENNSDIEPTSHLQLDLGDDTPLFNIRESNRLGNQTTGMSASSSNNNDSHRREDNPFSFKHFLRSDSASTSYQAKGARPKVYENRSASSDFKSNLPESKPARLLPEYSSALPDFVQDHLVIEQCYLGNNPSNDYDLDINNLPDFTPGRQNRKNGGNLDNNSSRTPLDLPIRSQEPFPLDLPMTAGSISGHARNGPVVSEVGNSKSLPDFLADSAVCTQKSDTLSVPHSPEGESERLRNELDITKRHLEEKNRICDSLCRELEIARHREKDYTQNLARALEKVEDNLEKSNRRAAAAENMVVKLKQEIKSLMLQLNSAKSNIHNTRGDEAAGGQGYFHSTNHLHYHQLAQELRNAAGSAEHSLRQLLTGVDNLRLMAATLENTHRIEDTGEPFSNFDEDVGPAP